MSKIELIKAEIERRIAGNSDARARVLSEILTLINSLPDEPSENIGQLNTEDLEQAVVNLLFEFFEEYDTNPANRAAIPGIYANEIIKRVSYWQKEHPSEDLEQAAEEYEKGLSYYECINQWPSVGFIAGAKWQKEQMMKILNEYQEKGVRCIQQSADADEQGEATYWDGFYDACLAIEREIQEDKK